MALTSPSVQWQRDSGETRDSETEGEDQDDHACWPAFKAIPRGTMNAPHTIHERFKYVELCCERVAQKYRESGVDRQDKLEIPLRLVFASTRGRRHPDDHEHVPDILIVSDEEKELCRLTSVKSTFLAKLQRVPAFKQFHFRVFLHVAV